jgi:hypothetical protein
VLKLIEWAIRWVNSWRWNLRERRPERALECYSPTERSFDQIAFAAIAIKTTSRGQQHLGLLHRNHEANAIEMLHLEWHCELTNELPKQSYFWIPPDIPSRRLRQVAAMCRKVWRSNSDGIGYGFSSPHDCFDRTTGQFLLGPTRHGLTCSSFVVAVFWSSGIPLLKYSTWPRDRAGDIEWQQSVLDTLREGGAAESHIEAVRRGVGSVRLRPEEVAGAAVEYPPSVTFAQASARAAEVLARIGLPRSP